MIDGTLSPHEQELREAYSKLVEDYRQLVGAYQELYRLLVASTLMDGETKFAKSTLDSASLGDYQLDQSMDEDGSIILRAVEIPKEDA